MPRLLKKDWIIAYSEAIDPISEAPRQYNIWSAISLVGAVLKKRVWLHHGEYTIHTNQFVVLTGPPGVGKGTALHSAYNLGRALNLVNVISDRITAPQIIERLAAGPRGQAVMSSNGQLGIKTDSTAVLMSPELATLLTSSDWMLTLLCDLWDRGEYEYDTKNSGSATVKGMCVSLIGGCVPDYIRKINRDTNATISSGFTARTIFVYAEEPSKKLPWPKSLDSSVQGKLIKKNLLNDLEHISKLTGEFKMHPEAEKYFENWYNKKLVNSSQDSLVIQYFKGRVKIHVLKLAMIFCAADSDDLMIKEYHMIMSITSLQDVQRNLDKAFRGVGNSPLVESMALIQNFLEKKLAATRPEIFTAVHKEMTIEMLDACLANLKMTQYLKSNDVIMPNNQGTKVVYSLTDKAKRDIAAIDATTPDTLKKAKNSLNLNRTP